MILSFWSKFSDFFTNIGKFVAKQGRNPIFWTIVVVITLILFRILYSALDKE